MLRIDPDKFPPEDLNEDSFNPRNAAYYQVHTHHNPIGTKVASSGLKIGHFKKPEKHDHDDENDLGTKKLNVAFEWILQETTSLLQAVNAAIKKGVDNRKLKMEQTDPGDIKKTEESIAEAAAEYKIAATEYNWFVDGLNNQSLEDKVGPTINWAVVDPIMIKQYYAGANVVVRWLGGSHSDSSGIAIKHTSSSSA